MATRLGTLALALVCAPACTSFATLRSASVRPGASLTVQASLASPPGDDAAWFWSLDCASDCDHAITSMDLAFAYGTRSTAAPPMTFGFGLNGTSAYLETYLQLGRSKPLPFGVGARLGLPIESWHTHQVYGRLDVRLSQDARLLLNPGLFYHTGASPNGQNPGSFVGLVQGVGFELGSGSLVITPGLAAVWGRAERTSYGQTFGPTSRLFATVSLGITFRRSTPS